MASLELRPEGGYRVVFRVGGKKYGRSLGTKCERTANVALAQLELNLHRLEQGKLSIEPGDDLAAVLLSKKPRCTKRPQRKTPRQKRRVNRDSQSIGDLLRGYLGGINKDSMENSTWKMIEIHVRHLERIMGANRLVTEVSNDTLQKYINTRSGEKGRRGKNVSPTTIRKEITTLAAAWRWGLAEKRVSMPLPRRMLRYPKASQRAPFQTMEQIERRIARNQLSEQEQACLWDCLFLTRPEIDELLAHVRVSARHDFIYPLFTFAAHTGARRSEILRSEIDDLDFGAMAITIRERKRIKGQHSTRTVPMTKVLADVLQEWLERHPGGRFTFSFSIDLSPLTRDQAVDHFRRTLQKSKWDVVRGYHVLRHSFCSNAAAKGIDQRLINSWVGHQTEEMVRRYRHLIPMQSEIEAVFA